MHACAAATIVSPESQVLIAGLILLLLDAWLLEGTFVWVWLLLFLGKLFGRLLCQKPLYGPLLVVADAAHALQLNFDFSIVVVQQ